MSAVGELIAEVLRLSESITRESEMVQESTHVWSIRAPDTVGLRRIAIAAQQERVEGREAAVGCSALASSPKAPGEAGNRPSVDMPGIAGADITRLLRNR